MRSYKLADVRITCVRMQLLHIYTSKMTATSNEIKQLL